MIEAILLILLLNITLGCLAAYINLERVTLYDLIISIMGGIFIFIFEVSFHIISRIEDEASNIILFRRKE